MTASLSRCRDGWDVLIIGAGPAGTSAAQCVARAGLNVLILEKRRQVGVPVQCAEYIPLAMAGMVDLPAQAVSQTVDTMRTFIQGNLAQENRWPGVILDRAYFDQAMAERAVALGAKLLTGCRVEGMNGDQVFFRDNGRPRRATARVVVGADGPLSMTGRSMGLRNREFLFGLQVEIHLAGDMNHTEVHFRPEFRGGYGWIFPKGASANVGVGVVRAAAGALPGLLHAFADELRTRGIIGLGPPLRKTGGLIPAGGPHPRTVSGDRLLVGDAAGQTDPITGGGILAAILCGRMAGEAVSQALKADEPERIGRYEEAWRDLLGPSLERARQHRERLDRDWGQGSFERLIQGNWIGFREYYCDRAS